MSKKGFSVCYSDSKDAEQAMKDICTQMDKNTPALILFFSDVRNFSFYSAELYRLYPDAEIVGATTYVTFSSKGHSREGITVLAVSQDIECAGGIITDIKRYPQKHIHVIHESMNKLSNLENCCCLEFTTAFDACEEIVQDTLRSVLEKHDISVIGGSAGNAGNSTESYVSYNGEIYSEACAFVLLKNRHGKIHYFCENIYYPTDRFFYATDVDCEERTVYEFDGMPAAKVLAKALNVKESDLPAQIALHPLGRMINDNVYIADHNTVTEDGALTYFTRIYNYTKMALLEAKNPQEVLTDTICKIHDNVNRFRFMFVVNCLSRTQLFETMGIFDTFTNRLTEELGDYVGLSGYGEQMNYEHLNKTMLIVIFE